MDIASIHFAATVDPANLVAAVASVFALTIALLSWRRQKAVEAKSYLILGLRLERVGDHNLIAHTSLENRSPTVKKLTTVCLLLCPGDEDFGNACKTLESVGMTKVRDFKDLGNIALERSFRDSHRALMPLPYYTKENTEVADEVLTYGAVLNIENLTPGQPYSVRLILCGPNRLHRVVHEAFVR